MISGNFVARTKARKMRQFIETRNAPEHVLETGLIRLVIGNILDRRGTARSLLHQARETLDALPRSRCPHSPLRRRPDPSRPGARALPRHPARRKSSATAAPFHKHVIGEPSSAWPHKIGQNHAVTPGLPRSHGVEEPRNDHRQAFLFPVRKREEFIQRLRGGVTPAALGRRAEHQVGVFMKGNVGILSRTPRKWRRQKPAFASCRPLRAPFACR